MKLRLALALVLPLLMAAPGMWVHGIVQDEAYQRVNGGHVWLERKWGYNWLIAPCCEKHPMQGHAFQFDVPQPGRYRVQYEKDGYRVISIRYDEFTLPEGAPSGDIVVNVRRVTAPTATPIVPTRTPRATYTAPPVPTTLYPPTVNPTATATPTPTRTPTPDTVCFSFQQFSYTERRAVLNDVAAQLGRPLEAVLYWDTDETLVYGLREQLLGMPGSRRLEVAVGGVTLTVRAFCNAIIVIRDEPNPACLGYGVVGYEGTQNWMAQ